MSSLWTPDGERPAERQPAPAADDPVEDLSPEDRARLQEMQAQMEEVRNELLGVPAAVVLANHAMGIYELAAIHLTASEPQLTEASVAIDRNANAPRMP